MLINKLLYGLLGIKIPLKLVYVFVDEFLNKKKKSMDELDEIISTLELNPYIYILGDLDINLFCDNIEKNITENEIDEFYDNIEDLNYIELCRNSIKRIRKKHSLCLTQNSKRHPNGLLPIVSNKYSKILKNIDKTKGSIFCYSEYRNIEGLELFKNILDMNGYKELNLGENKTVITFALNDKVRVCNKNSLSKDKKSDDNKWYTGVIIKIEKDVRIGENKYLVQSCQDPQKKPIYFLKNKLYHCCYSLWTGTETEKLRKEILEYFNYGDINYESLAKKNHKLIEIYDNYEWRELRQDDNISLIDKQKKRVKQNIYPFWDEGMKNENIYGQKCLILLATKSGAEGISLENVRQVNVIEPYWNMVRIDQVIGRARRIQSHLKLKKENRNVKIFIYKSVFSERQKKNNWNKKLSFEEIDLFGDNNYKKRQFAKLKSIIKSRKEQYSNIVVKDKLFTSDDKLFNLAYKKNIIIQQFLLSIKKNAVDCRLNLYDNKQTNDIYKEPGFCNSNILDDKYNYYLDNSNKLIKNKKNIFSTQKIITKIRLNKNKYVRGLIIIDKELLTLFDLNEKTFSFIDLIKKFKMNSNKTEINIYNFYNYYFVDDVSKNEEDVSDFIAQQKNIIGSIKKQSNDIDLSNDDSNYILKNSVICEYKDDFNNR